jgi:hypothetical protein
MGHYDNCRPGYCAVCGQTGNLCGHGKTNPEEGRARANDIQHGGDHYKGAAFQHWDLISENHIGYLEGCATKYASRWRKKNGVEDLKKAVHYCDKLTELVYDSHYRPSGSASYTDLRRFFNENKIEDSDERYAIECLTTWSHVDQIFEAKRALQRLLQKAQDLAVVG